MLAYIQVNTGIYVSQFQMFPLSSRAMLLVCFINI